MNYSDKDIDITGRTLWGECRGEPHEGQVAVGWVIRNRAERPRFAGQIAGQPGSAVTVCKANWQFSCWWDNQKPYLEALTADKMQPQLDVAKAVFSGAVADPTNGADHYHTIEKPVWAQNWPPYWAPGMVEVARFGGHVFYDSRLKKQS
jgi:spore germination cell wall hydrolase CwlJ-like protein